MKKSSSTTTVSKAATKTGRVSAAAPAKSNAPKQDTSAIDAMIARDAEAPPAMSEDMLKRITDNAALLKERTAHVTDLERQTDEAKAQVRELAERVLPALMEEAQVMMVGLDDGEGTWIERFERVFASMSKENSERGCAWLDANGYGSLVKSSITIPLQRGDTKTQKAVVAALKKIGVACEVTSGVHAATLLAFAKESLAEGRKLPDEIKVFTQPVVELKKPKARKPKKSVATHSTGNDIDMDRPF